MTENSTGDQILFKILKDREKHIYYAESLLRNREAAEDAVSDSISNLLKRWDSMKKDSLSMVYSYFYKLLRSTCIDELRRRARTEARFRYIIDADIEVLDKNFLSDQVQADEIQSILNRSREDVDESSYDYFICNRVDGMTYKEIAKHYNISEGKVMRGIQKVIKVLKESLKEYITPLIIGIIFFVPQVLYRLLG